MQIWTTWPFKVWNSMLPQNPVWLSHCGDCGQGRRQADCGSSPPNFLLPTHGSIPAPSSSWHPLLSTGHTCRKTRQADYGSSCLPPFLQTQPPPHLIPRSVAGFLLWPLLTFCPFPRGQSRPWFGGHPAFLPLMDALSIHFPSPSPFPSVHINTFYLEPQ